jgi:hypothetical protein
LRTTSDHSRRIAESSVSQDDYNRVVITRGIREFVNRDWDGAREAKDRYWGERIAALGADEGFRIAEELRMQALACDPSWPHAEERRRDLEAHIRLAGVFRRAGSASRR